MDVIYLDQNKWIDFSKVEARKETSSEIVSLYSDLRAAVERNEVMFPLSLSHVLETSKINDFARREHLALTQSKLSKGWVIRSRKCRLVIELRCALKRAFGEQEIALSDTWMFAQGFMQAFEPFDDFVAAKTEVVRNRLLNNFQSPEALLFRFLTGQDDSNRRRGIASFSKGSDALIDRIEKRRRKIANISKEMKWRAYGALLFYDHQDLIASVLSSIGKTVDQFKQLA